MSQKELTIGTKVIFVGGNNDVGIGANALIIEHKDVNNKTYKILIDDGSKLTMEDQVYDGICPDIREELDSIDAIFLTHTHTDHDGGLQTLEMLGHKLPPIYGSEYSLAAYNLKRAQAGLGDETKGSITKIQVGEPIKFGNGIEIEAFKTSHSALGSIGFHVLTKIGERDNVGLVFPGDFNLREMEAKSEDGTPHGFDKKAYQDLISRKKTTHVFMDSTSTETPDDYIFDKETCVQSWVGVMKNMKDSHKEQLFTAIISGSGEHLIKLAEAVRQYNAKYDQNRKLFVDSPNLKVSMKAAEIAGLDSYEDVIFSGNAKDFTQKYPPKQRVIVLSGAFADGTQKTSAEKAATGKSGAAKLSEQEKNQKAETESLSGHPNFKITPDDVWVQSQRDVGINSKGIKKINNKFAALGATIYQVQTYPDASLGNYPMKPFQSSGHAGNKETKEFLGYHNKDTLVIPIHGDLSQLDATANIAQDEGYKSQVFENADKILVTSANALLLQNNERDKTAYLAFRREPSINPSVRTTIIDEVNVYPDINNPKKENIVFLNKAGEHEIFIYKGQWLDKEKLTAAKENDSSKKLQTKPFKGNSGR
ncbi:MAG: MBL fold metallo-hydrolase [Alphaproteobacteria bacterium]